MTSQVMTSQVRTGQVRTGQVMTGQARTGQVGFDNCQHDFLGCLKLTLYMEICTLFMVLVLDQRLLCTVFVVLFLLWLRGC